MQIVMTCHRLSLSVIVCHCLSGAVTCSQGLQGYVTGGQGRSWAVRGRWRLSEGWSAALAVQLVARTVRLWGSWGNPALWAANWGAFTADGLQRQGGWRLQGGFPACPPAWACSCILRALIALCGSLGWRRRLGLCLCLGLRCLRGRRSCLTQHRRGEAISEHLAVVT